MTDGFYARVCASATHPRGRRYPVLWQTEAPRDFVDRRIKLGTIIFVFARNEFPHKLAFVHGRHTYGAGELLYPELVRLTPLEVLTLGVQS